MEGTYIKLTYYSKSKCFLYPILGYSRKETFRAQSFLFFREHSIDDGQLVVFYPHEQNSLLFENFEKTKIQGNSLLRKVYKAPTGSVYIFDIGAWKADIDHFLSGNYSKLSKHLKTIILQYIDDNIDNTEPSAGRAIHAVLFPSKYRTLVATELGVPVENLTELAPVFDRKGETLDIVLWEESNPTTTPI